MWGFEMRSSNLFRRHGHHGTAFKATAGVLAALMIWMPSQSVVADAMQDSGALGQSSGMDSVQQFVMPTMNADGTGVTLFPGSGKDVDVKLDDLFPDSANGDASTYTSLYGDDPGTIAAGLGAQTSLGTETSNLIRKILQQRPQFSGGASILEVSQRGGMPHENESGPVSTGFVTASVP